MQKIKLSNRSNTPPCPGIKFPESLTLNFLFSLDSARSPIGANIAIIILITIQLPRKPGSRYSITNPAIMVDTIPPINPSTDLLGDILGASFRLPNLLPIR